MPTVDHPLSKAAQTRETYPLPVYRKPGLYCEAWRRLETLKVIPGDSPMTLPCVSRAPIIGSAYATDAPAVCLNIGQCSPSQHLACTWLCGGFKVAFWWLCTPESMPSICLLYGFRSEEHTS